MRIGINVSFLRKPDTGIGQVTRGFVAELLKSKSRKNEYFLYLEKDLEKGSDPFKGIGSLKNIRKRVFLPFLWRRDDLVRKIWWEKFLLPRKIKKDKCDVFISLYQCPTFLPKTIRHKMLVHDLIPKIFPEYLDNWRKKLYFYLSCKAIRRADEVITISEWSKKDIHKYLKIEEKEIKVAYPSVGREFFEGASHEKDNRVLEKYGVYGRFIFYVGGFDFRKNIPELLRAYKKLLERYEINDVNLILAGEDKSKYSPLFTNIQEEVDNLGLKERVKTIGFVKQKDLPAFYRQCEIFVLPSLYEGFGLMALEAMASGAPAAVSKSSSLIEVGGDAVLYFNPYDSAEISRVMRKILENAKLRFHLAEKGRKRAQRFLWKNFVEAILK